MFKIQTLSVEELWVFSLTTNNHARLTIQSAVSVICHRSSANTRSWTIATLPIKIISSVILFIPTDIRCLKAAHSYDDKYQCITLKKFNYPCT